MSTFMQRRFTGGELDPALHSGTDLAKYGVGAKVIRNMFVKKSGGLSNRGGTTFVEEVRNSSKGRLIPFVFNPDDTFYLEFTNLKIRVFKGRTYTGVELDSPYTTEQIPFIQKYQKGNEMLLTHPGHPVQKLYRDLTDVSDDWYMDPYQISTDLPGRLTGLVVSATGPGTAESTTHKYAVTSFYDNGQESIDANVTQTGLIENLAPDKYVQLGWTPDAPGITYNVYKMLDGVWGLIGVVVSQGATYQANMFRDVGVTPDTTSSIPQKINYFDEEFKYPATVAIIQQRTWFAGAYGDPEMVYGSMTGQYDTFIKRSPGDAIRDSDSLSFRADGPRLNRVHFLVDIGGVVLLTEEGEVFLEGQGNGIVTPSEITPKFQSYNGSRPGVAPEFIDNVAVFLQKNGAVLRELGFSFESDGYRGNDLTTFASHLFEGRIVVSMAYQKTPHSILWVVFDDGQMVSLTRVREQEIAAFTRHDFENGAVESVCTVPENNEDAIYLIVRRTIDGVTKRYIERMDTRTIKNIEDVKILDSSLTYDGRNYSLTKTLKITGGLTWASDEELTLVCNENEFSADDVGDEFHLKNGEEKLFFEVTSYVSATQVKGFAKRTVPLWARDVETLNWSHAVNGVTGLEHLEGEAVSIFADGFTVASPYNPRYEIAQVVDGGLSLQNHYSVIHVGLPITSDLETLDIDSAQGESLATKSKLITQVALRLQKTRGLFVGTERPTGDDALLGLQLLKPRKNEGMYQPNDFIDGMTQITTEARWNKQGQVFVRQVDPEPLEILSIAPIGIVNAGG